MNKISPLVYIIILNWNLPEATIACVESVLSSSYQRKKILLVDNGSTDQSARIFQDKFGSRIEYLFLDQNHGFGRGNNTGIKYCLDRGADYTLLLNNDTTIDKLMITELINCVQTDQNIGIAGPLIYYNNQPNRVWYSGMKIWKKLYVAQHRLHTKSKLNHIEDVDFISGCGMLVKNELWERIGLFSPEYFMYYEDLDLCLSAQKAGFRRIVATRAKMWHQIAASSGGSYSAKHTKSGFLLLNLIIRLGHTGFTVIKQIISRQLTLEIIRYYFRGVKEAFEGNQK